MREKLGWGLVGVLRLLSGGAAEACAKPVEGRVGAFLRPPHFYSDGSAAFATGGMAELSLRDSPWFVGGLLAGDSYKGGSGLDFSGEQQRTLWSGYRWRFSEATTAGALVGGNQYRPMPIAAPPQDAGATAVFDEKAWRPMLGISFTHRWAWGPWIRLTPHYVFKVDRSPYPAYLDPASSEQDSAEGIDRFLRKAERRAALGRPVFRSLEFSGG